MSCLQSRLPRTQSVRVQLFIQLSVHQVQITNNPRCLPALTYAAPRCGRRANFGCFIEFAQLRRMRAVTFRVMMSATPIGSRLLPLLRSAKTHARYGGVMMNGRVAVARSEMVGCRESACTPRRWNEQAQRWRAVIDGVNSARLTQVS